MTQELPTSVKEIMDGMPGAFQPDKAAGVRILHTSVLLFPPCVPVPHVPVTFPMTVTSVRTAAYHFPP